MRIAYGWPKLFNTAVLDDARQPVDAGQVIAIGRLEHYVLVTFERAVQLWSSDQVGPVRIGQAAWTLAARSLPTLSAPTF